MSAPTVAAVTVATTAAAAGALAGAFVPRVAYRLSVPRPAPPGSACAGCATPFPAGVAGWVRAGAGCPGCGRRLGPPTWLTVAAGALACGVPPLVLVPDGAAGGRATAAAALVLAAFLLAGVAGVLLAAIDLACLRLPDVIVGPLFVVTLALLGASTVVSGADAARSQLLRAGLAAAAMCAGYLVLALVPGANLGLGDVKLSAALGLLLGWLGWGAVLLGVALPHLINGPVALVLLLTRRADRKTSLPLGPALLAGALAAVAGHAVLRG